MKVLQLRGVNCFGKTTAAYGYFKKHGISDVVKVDAAKKPKGVPITVSGDVVAIGDYSVIKQTAGADCCGSIQTLFDALSGAMRLYPDKDIFFESFLFGMSMRFESRLDSFCRDHGYEFESVWLKTDLSQVKQRLSGRHGNGRRNWDRIISSASTFARVHEYLITIGITDHVIDTTNMDLNDMGQIIDHYLKQ